MGEVQCCRLLPKGQKKDQGYVEDGVGASVEKHKHLCTGRTMLQNLFAID